LLPTLQIGPIAVQTPGLVIILGIWIGLTLTERVSLAYQTNPNKLYTLVFTILISGILGARLTYIIRYYDIFINSPLSIFALNPGLLDITGGIGAGFIGGLIYTNRKKFPLWATLDALTPLFGVMMISFSISQFASGDGYGVETQLPWGIELWGEKRHPIQIYYLLAELVILLIILPRRQVRAPIFKENGSTFLCFIAQIAAVHVFLDAFRGDIELTIFNVRTNQVIAWVVLAGSLFGLRISKQNNLRLEKSHEY